jgi:DNA/RNA endonuclease G (NUC1)
MRASRTFNYLFLIAFLTALFFQVPAIAQTCSGCEIPSAQRTARLNASNQALQTAGSQQSALNTLHCPFGLPASPANADNERLLYQFEWITRYDDDLRMPLWVAYELTKAESSAQVATRQDCFRRDSRLSSDDASFCEDYDEPLFDRGHMVPANDMKRAQSSMDNSFLFSNMAPQFSNFNQKVWERLESKVHGWAISADGVHVITGAVFDRNNDGRRDDDDDAQRVSPRNRVAIATHFYKIIIHRRPNSKIDTISFLLPHNTLSNTNNDNYLKGKIVTIDSIETVTGIDFFPNMETQREQQIEQGKASSLSMWFTF